MKTAEKLPRDYKEGRTTATDLMLEVLYLPDARAIEQALAILPADVLKKLKSFVAHFSSKTVIVRGHRPEMQAVQSVRSAFRRKKRRAPAKT
jgi:hypothetical protein